VRKAYEDPESHFKRHMEQSANKYMDGLQRAGLKPNAKLTRAMAARAANEAGQSYIRETMETRDANISSILKDHNKRMNMIKRQGAALRLKTCPPIAFVFGVLAWYAFNHPVGFIPGAWIIYACMSLAFLVMLVLGAIFDRPKG
jgi:hypothetical protein